MLGLGDTGLSMARWLARRGARVRVADTPRRAAARGGARRASCRDVPLDDAAPSTRGDASQRRRRDRASARASTARECRAGRRPIRSAACRCVGDIELFAQALPAARDGSTLDCRRPKVLAITGTNGKSTVTAMAGDMCRAAGCETVVAGNIGLPVLDALAAIEDGAPLPAGLRARALQLPAREHRDASPPTPRRCSI